MRVMSSSGYSGMLIRYLFFITVAMAYHASLRHLAVSGKYSGATSILTPVVINNSKTDIQVAVESISQMGESLESGVLVIDAESMRVANDIEITTEIRCLALNIYFEARGESNEGQLAVGHVVMNRTADDKFPNTVCEVVKQGGEKYRNRCQFSWWCDGKDDVPRNKQSWLASVRLAYEINNGWTTDPTGGALWYHATYVKPYWRRAFAVGPEIGRHIFYSYV